MQSDELNKQVNKRLTMNLLIQGAAAHGFITASYLVKDALESIDPGYPRMCDRFGIGGMLNYHLGDNTLLFGRPNRWFGYSSTPQPMLQNHPLMAEWGNRLANEDLQFLRQRAKQKGVIRWPGGAWFQLIRMYLNLRRLEQPHRERLAQLAARAVAEIWDFPIERIDGRITEMENVPFGNLQSPRSRSGRMARAAAIAYGGVERRGGQFHVVARATVYPLLVHELIKGTVELISLHGLGPLDESTYRHVIEEADQIEYEAWMLQSGPALWRRLLEIAPRDRPLARTVMTLARLEPDPLDALMFRLLEDPESARRELDRLV